jgi:hypothetical protein
MASITLTIPDALVTRVLNGFCGLHGYQATIPNPVNPEEMIPNPDTKAEFMRKKLLAIIKRAVLEYEGNEAQRASLAAGDTSVQL